VLTPAKLAELSPPAVANPSDNLKNLFELPVIFYALAAGAVRDAGGRRRVRGGRVGVRGVPGSAQRRALHEERDPGALRALRDLVARAVVHGRGRAALHHFSS
jgi:hypothetical protein